VGRCARALLEYPLLLFNIEDVHIIVALALVESAKHQNASVLWQQRRGVAPAWRWHIAHHVSIFPHHRLLSGEQPCLVEHCGLALGVDSAATEEHGFARPWVHGDCVPRSRRRALPLGLGLVPRYLAQALGSRHRALHASDRPSVSPASRNASATVTFSCCEFCFWTFARGAVRR